MNAEEVKFFKDQGFLALENAIDLSRIHAAAQEAAAMFAEIPDGTGAELVQYESNLPPLETMSRIDHPHLASAAIAELIRDSGVASAAATLLGAEAVQAWYCHVSRKPPRSGLRTQIGWHQDGQYTEFMSGRFVTAWIPLTHIDEHSAPICYVPGSQNMGVIGSSESSGRDDPETLKEFMLREHVFDWCEIEVCTEPGAVVFHDSLTIHGSRYNDSNRPRIALAIHLRGENNIIDTSPKYRVPLSQFQDEYAAPVVYGDRRTFVDLAPVQK